MNLIALPTPDEWALKHLEGCDHRVRVRRLIEVALVRKLAETLIAAGCTISVDDGEDVPVKKSTDVGAIVDACFAVDECRLAVFKGKKHEGTILLVFGNDGWDAISDYNTSLEELLTPVNEYAEQLSMWC